MTDRIEPPHPNDAPDYLDQVSEEVHRAVTTANVPVTGLERGPEQNEAAKALTAAAVRKAEQDAAARQQLHTEPEPEPATPDHEPRSIEALAAITNRVGPSETPVSLRIPNRLAAAIIAMYREPQADIGQLEFLEIIADHIHAHLPATIGPDPVDQWLERIEAMQAQDLGRIDQDKLDAWTEAHDSDVRA